MTEGVACVAAAMSAPIKQSKGGIKGRREEGGGGREEGGGRRDGRKEEGGGRRNERGAGATQNNSYCKQTGKGQTKGINK